MAAPLNLDQIKTAKATLEASVLSAIQLFEKQTGQQVNAIALNHTSPAVCSQCTATVVISL